MKKGLIRITIGSILLAVQILAILGDLWLESTSYGNYQLTGFFENLGFYWPGICGLILIALGNRARKDKRDAQLILHVCNKKSHFIIKIVVIILLSILLILLACGIVSNGINVVNAIFTTSILMQLIYLIFHIGKKPAMFLSAAFAFAGVYFLLSSVSINNIIFTINHPISIVNSVLMIILGVIYIILSIRVYKESTSFNSIRILGWITLILVICIYIIHSIIYNFININIVLPLSLFMCTNIFTFNNMSVLFCRKCGERLTNNQTCDMCGTEIVENTSLPVEENKY